MDNPVPGTVTNDRLCVMVGDENDSGMVRRSLGRRLKALRLSAGKTHVHVREARLGSRQKLARLENGTGPYKPADVRHLCWLYGASQDETDELHDLCMRAGESRIFDDNSDLVPNWFTMFAEMERFARSIDAYQSELVPGLFQTADYARAVFSAVRPSLTQDVIDRLVITRSQRQAGVLRGRGGPKVHAVLSEGALLRQVGGVEAMSAQLKHLEALCATPQVTVSVLTWQTGAHAALTGPFTLLRFPDPEEPSVAYVESPAGARYINNPRAFGEYSERFDAIAEQSITLEEYVA